MPSYNDNRYQTRQLLPISDAAGCSVAGTAAADSILFRFRVPKSITIDGASIVALTGGTAAGGPIIALQKSVGGTGTLTSFSSYAFNTHANNASVAMTVTSTNFSSGDHIAVVNLAGTNASTPKINMLLEFVEKF